MNSIDSEQIERSCITAFVSSERAVTPVIGIILLVAITVILAAVIGTFTLGMGDRVQDFAPSTRIGFDFDADASGESCGLAGGGGPDQGELTITHQGGDKIEESQLTLVDDDGNETSWNNCATSGVTDITAGDKATPHIDSDDTIRLVWNSENDVDDTSVVAKFEGPDA